MGGYVCTHWVYVQHVSGMCVCVYGTEQQQQQQHVYSGRFITRWKAFYYLRRSSDVYLEEVEGVTTHELPHDCQRHLVVAVNDVQPPDVDHGKAHHLCIQFRQKIEKKTP